MELLLLHLKSKKFISAKAYQGGQVCIKITSYIYGLVLFNIAVDVGP